MSGIAEKGKSVITVREWTKDETQAKKLEKINKLAQREKTNIYKISYKPIENSSKQTIIVYVAAGDMEALRKEFDLSKDESLVLENGSDKFLSSINTGDKNQTGIVKIFTPSIVLELRNIQAATNENIRGNYLINSKNIEFIKKIKNEFDNNLGLETEALKREKSNILDQLEYNKYVFIVIAIIVALIFLSFIYYILLRYKELAIKKCLDLAIKN